ncbi:hypothetical protein M8C21_011924 [Ambrosia artemisiifolia]|uniref:Uncharacterized protein n=1 Tax=Ambrosia artemisiifolia TaxID=4212 RepID=A0AAD5BQD0_AMBAR|nr:hypothetical protein M8C21_011924 [Ambrosia artemisiifolia]
MKRRRSKGDFSNFLGNNLKSDEIKVVFRFASRHPLDFLTVDMRLLHGTCSGPLEAFLEDDRKLWINLGKNHVNTPSLVKLSDDTSKDFKLKHENEVYKVAVLRSYYHFCTPLWRKLSEHNWSRKLYAEVVKELEELLGSLETLKCHWKHGSTKYVAPAKMMMQPNGYISQKTKEHGNMARLCLSRTHFPSRYHKNSTGEVTPDSGHGGAQLHIPTNRTGVNI